MKVVVGTTVLNNGSGQVYDIEEFRIHENYNDKEIRNDIGIIKLKKSITFNNNIRSISLGKEDIGGGKSLILTGWGKTQYPGKTTKKLQKIDLVSVSDSDCAKIYAEHVDQRNLCTEGKPGRGACQGDSGGPLVFEGTQVGIVSWGIACAKGKPDVFTDVSSFGNWIVEHMK
ncbi:hypothetical protein WA026_011513 [Henosepilachna vigintioctopunctata]|uniref:Peptidase S1 domain-containing protein n=1 Tax=Henosepilachna vigintioctopunctata TaxID=420089 RepID=A0AAW1TSE8_9CUCU